ncbi:unnamed protein product, partial [Iphiclides podalirius]
MTLKVKEFCEAEQKNQGVLIPLNNVRKRVAAITGVSEKTITRITKEGFGGKECVASYKSSVVASSLRVLGASMGATHYALCRPNDK